MRYGGAALSPETGCLSEFMASATDDSVEEKENTGTKCFLLYAISFNLTQINETNKSTWKIEYRFQQMVLQKHLWNFPS
jgi:hypothetical protein